MLPTWLAAPFLLILTLHAQGDPLDHDSLSQRTNSSQVSTPGLTLSSSQTADFLPVHEAYQLHISPHADNLILDWQIAEHYFLYGEQFHFVLTQNQQTLPLEIQKEAGEVAYDDYFEKEVEKFRFSTRQTLRFSPPAQHEPLILQVSFQGCADAGLCYPPETLTYHIDLDTLSATLRANPAFPDEEVVAQVSTSSTSQDSFLQMFIFALIGGLILNLMPCVFPVLSIKLLSFARSNQSDSHVREHSWFYTLGILVTFLCTALLLILLRQSGAAIGWGYQLQSPLFIALLAILFLLLALSMSGFIPIGTRLMGVGQQLTEGNHYSNSFFTGVLAVIVASPCSVPFMGVALGYALTQPIYAALIIFGGLGLGFAAPFLLFGYVPWLIQHLPKPGPWMEKLKHWLALPLYLSTLWLLWVLWHQVVSPEPDKQSPDSYWEPYSAETINQYLAADEAVFVELTADWCITCLVNEKVALTRPAVLKAIKSNNIHYLRGDWTNRDPAITELLKKHQRAGVPLYLFYDQNENLTVLPQILTEQIILDVIAPEHR